LLPPEEQIAQDSEGLVGILDSTSEEPKSRLRRYIMTGAVFVLLIVLGLWWLLRYHSEKRAVLQFMDLVVTGEFEKAYQAWKPAASYSYHDFLDDWGAKGYYGPVKSYRMESASKPDGGSGVVIVVELSQFQPFPEPKDTTRSRRNKEVRIWVESSDLSMRFAP
jgi:hypothetical protein